MTRLLQRYLGSGDTLARLHDHAARLRRLQTAFVHCIPPQLTEACQVANLKGDVLVVLARNGAAAAKLKQLAPRVQEQLAAGGHAVGSIQVKVQVQFEPEARPAPAPRMLPDSGRRSLAEFMDSLPADSPLRDSIAHLLERSRKG